MYAFVVPFSRSFDEIWLIYEIPEDLINSIKIWQIVNIPLQKKQDLWLVYKIEKDVKTDFNPKKIKQIISIQNENQLIKWYSIDLLLFISKHYLTPIHNSLSLFLPKNTREKIKKNKLDFSKTSDYNYEINIKYSLTKEQNRVYEEILKKENNKILLYGITWSWKTEIYIQLIKYYLDLWKQSLLLIPEIILWNQTLEKIKKFFWKDVIIINSTITETKKTKYFLDIYHNKAKIILWTRSALFYPYNNLWIIIIDEEHDNSYISDQPPRYNAIEIWEKINELSNIKLLLASWTPSINSMYKWIKGKYKVINLLEKFKSK